MRLEPLAGSVAALGAPRADRVDLLVLGAGLLAVFGVALAIELRRARTADRARRAERAERAEATGGPPAEAASLSEHALLPVLPRLVEEIARLEGRLTALRAPSVHGGAPVADESALAERARRRLEAYASGRAAVKAPGERADASREERAARARAGAPTHPAGPRSNA